MTGDTAAGVEKREIPIIWTEAPVGAIRELGNTNFVTFEEFLATIGIFQMGSNGSFVSNVYV